MAPIAFLSVLVMFYFSLRHCQLRFLFFTTIVVKYHIDQWLCLILLEVSSVTVNIVDFYL